jgi:hypothetical protein
MDISAWVKRTDLSSPITEAAVLLTGRDGVLPTSAIGSGVFVADRLILTVKHVLQGYWDIYGDRKDVMERFGKKMAPFEMFAVQAPGRSGPAMWAASKLSLCPYSDLALISVVPVDEAAKAKKSIKVPIMNILPPPKGKRISAFGFASTQIVREEGNRVEFGLNPITSPGVITDVYPESRDSALLSFPSFEVQTHFIGGMSGGPIFNEEGELCGLVCSGYENTPVAYGVVLWPIIGIRIDHSIPGVVSEGPYTMLEMARSGLLKVIGWEFVDANVEEFEHSDGKPRVRLKIPEKHGQSSAT